MEKKKVWSASTHSKTLKRRCGCVVSLCTATVSCLPGFLSATTLCCESSKVLRRESIQPTLLHLMTSSCTLSSSCHSFATAAIIDFLQYLHQLGLLALYSAALTVPVEATAAGDQNVHHPHLYGWCPGQTAAPPLHHCAFFHHEKNFHSCGREL